MRCSVLPQFAVSSSEYRTAQVLVQTLQMD